MKTKFFTPVCALMIIPGGSYSSGRAEAAVNYLVKKGIAQDRLVAKGYGETRPVNGVPCTEAQYQTDRRTEIKILQQ